MAVTGNALILAAIWRNASLRTPSYILLAGLAVTDFVSGLITYPLFATDLLSNTAENEINCIKTTIFFAAARYFAAVTVETITVMAIERWLHMSRRSLITADGPI